MKPRPMFYYLLWDTQLHASSILFLSIGKSLSKFRAITWGNSSLQIFALAFPELIVQFNRCEIKKGIKC